MGHNTDKSGRISVRCSYCGRHVGCIAGTTSGMTVIVQPHTGKQGICPGSGRAPKK